MTDSRRHNWPGEGKATILIFCPGGEGNIWERRDASHVHGRLKSRRGRAAETRLSTRRARPFRFDARKIVSH